MRKFPSSRLRRNRLTPVIRDMVSEHSLSCSDLILPIFITDDPAQAVDIPSLPHTRRYLVEELPTLVEEATSLGCKAVILFGHIDDSKKDALGSHAYSDDNIVARGLRALRSVGDSCLLIADVALDPYTDHGHDGVLDEKNRVDNDATIDLLNKQALVLARAGAQVIAPSDMMDGRVAAQRQTLDDNGFADRLIMSYSAKFASSLYGPFRQAVGSAGILRGDKKTYQLDNRNAAEALHESSMDLAEGADWLIVKPGIFYLDILKQVADLTKVPVFAYQVSGEYAMIAAAESYGMDYKAVLMESLIAFKRAGASGIITYGALTAAKILRSL